MTDPPITSDRLAARLNTRWLGRALDCRDRTGSTNADALALGRAGGAHGTVVVADAQTSGRGRLGRRWQSPAGRNLYVSMLLRPAVAAERMAPVTLVAGVVLARTLAAEGGVDARLKWPNDVHVCGRKVAGILTEMEVVDGAEPFLVVGVGVNVHGAREELAPEIVETATTLVAEGAGAGTLDRAALLAAFLDALEPAVERFERSGLTGFVAEANRLHALAGQRVRVGLGAREVAGRAGEIREDGALEIARDDGSVLAITTGEVTLVRRAASPAAGEGAPC